LARQSSDFIIDEINRGNLSKIFGELLMLIEADKRDDEVCLSYTRESFVVPDNVYLIGMMNTADRSLAMMDYALRRRFAFVTMEPKFENDKFKEMMARTPDAKRDALVACVIRLNKEIRNDSGLGKGFEIGHSYFCGGLSPSDIVEFELIPLLEEYWYDAPEKVGEWTSKLREAVR
jgi:5-methylcytosine-specific restriction enzyme B